MSEEIKVCAFTGHRPVKFAFGYNEDVPNCIAIKSALEYEIVNMIDNGVTVFISGMALGVDTWAAEIVLRLKEDKYPALKLYCAIPCKGQENKWSAAAQKRYKSILQRAYRVSVLSQSYTRDCMFKRDKWMVDHAQYLIAVLKDGEESSGTGLTVKYAKEKERDIIRINPDTLEINNNIDIHQSAR